MGQGIYYNILCRGDLIWTASSKIASDPITLAASVGNAMPLRARQCAFYFCASAISFATFSATGFQTRCWSRANCVTSAGVIACT